MFQFSAPSKWLSFGMLATSFLLGACNFNLANSPFAGIPSFSNSSNSNQLRVIVFDSSDKNFAREMVSFLGRNKIQVITKNSSAQELLPVVNSISYEQYLAYVANSHGYKTWQDWQNQPEQAPTTVIEAPRAEPYATVSTKANASGEQGDINTNSALEQLPAGVARFDFAKLWATYPNVKLRPQLLASWNQEQDPSGFVTLFTGAHATPAFLASSELRKFLQDGLFGANAAILSQEQWLALQLALQSLPHNNLLAFRPAIESCRTNLTYACVQQYLPTLRVTNISTETKALSVFPNNGVVAQEAFIVSINTEFAIPGAGVIKLNDMSQNDYVSNQYTPLASINRNSLLLTTAYKDLSRKIATKVVFVFNNQKIGDRPLWQQLK